jgi:predicted RNase H-like HicB family nuclease
MTGYDVTVTREGQSWLADAPDVPGTHTWSRTLRALDRSIREAIALAEDLPEGAEAVLEIQYTYRTGDPELDEAAAQVRALRARLAAAERELVARTTELAGQIVRQLGLSVRDAAALLDVSSQRISQVTTARTPPGRRPAVGRGRVAS